MVEFKNIFNRKNHKWLTEGYRSHTDRAQPLDYFVLKTNKLQLILQPGVANDILI